MGYIESNRIGRDQARDIGDKLKVDWKRVNLDELTQGMNVELEHTDVTRGDPELTAKIALAHLSEIANYYTRLKEMEATKGQEVEKDEAEKKPEEEKPFTRPTKDEDLPKLPPSDKPKEDLPDPDKVIPPVAPKPEDNPAWAKPNAEQRRVSEVPDQRKPGGGVPTAPVKPEDDPTLVPYKKLTQPSAQDPKGGEQTYYVSKDWFKKESNLKELDDASLVRTFATIFAKGQTALDNYNTAMFNGAPPETVLKYKTEKDTCYDSLRPLRKYMEKPKEEGGRGIEAGRAHFLDRKKEQAKAEKARMAERQKANAGTPLKPEKPSKRKDKVADPIVQPVNDRTRNVVEIGMRDGDKKALEHVVPTKEMMESSVARRKAFKHYCAMKELPIDIVTGTYHAGWGHYQGAPLAISLAIGQMMGYTFGELKTHLSEYFYGLDAQKVERQRKAAAMIESITPHVAAFTRYYYELAGQKEVELYRVVNDSRAVKRMEDQLSNSSKNHVVAATMPGSVWIDSKEAADEYVKQQAALGRGTYLVKATVPTQNIVYSSRACGEDPTKIVPEVIVATDIGDVLHVPKENITWTEPEKRMQ